MSIKSTQKSKINSVWFDMGEIIKLLQKEQEVLNVGIDHEALGEQKLSQFWNTFFLGSDFQKTEKINLLEEFLSECVDASENELDIRAFEDQLIQLIQMNAWDDEYVLLLIDQVSKAQGW